MTTRDEQRLHGLLTAALVSDLAWNTAAVAEADGVGTLPVPEPIAGFRPDVIAQTSDILVLGEAKVLPRLANKEFVKKLRAWHDHPPQGFRKVVLTLAVPAGWRENAERLAASAGWTTEDVRVLEVGLPDGPAPAS
jgi:2-keto-3-deoxy-L-rhamnonate aldolase RhmA